LNSANGERSWRMSLSNFYFIISQNVAVCPKTFSNNTDSHSKWHAADTSSDMSPIKAQSQMLFMVSWDYTEY
jgi:hypothetical protein